MSVKPIGVLQFPGSNCDHDVFKAIQRVHKKVRMLWHRDHLQIEDYAGFVVPGGFSYGDYLRSGALAAMSPAAKDLMEANKKNYPILGICNGFQVLCELKLLPGALLKNESLRFIDQWVHLKITNANKTWVKTEKTHLQLPIAHGQGRYYCSEETLKSLQDSRQIWLQYEENPNGSVMNIAGITNKDGNVCGLMPHPERATADWMGGTDGLCFF